MEELAIIWKVIFVMKTFVRHIIITIIAFVLVWTFALIAYKLPFMSPIAEAIKDFEMTDVYYHILQDTNDGNEEVNDIVTIVDMSELYSRRELAKALQDIESYKPRVIGVDVVFEGLKEDSVGDEMIAEVALLNDNIVFSYKLLDYTNDSIGHAQTVHSFFAEEEGMVKEGFTNMPRNLYGGIKRKLSLSRKVQGKVVSSFIRMVVDLYMGKEIATAEEKDVNINFIPQRFRVVDPDSISYHPEWFADKLVLFGAMKEENDMHYTPLGKIAGTELLAYSIETLLEQNEVKEVNGWMTAFISFLLTLLTQVVFFVYTAFAKKRKNRVVRFLMSAAFIRSYIMFIWIAFWMWVAFILFYMYDITLNMGYSLSAMAFLVLSQSIYDEFTDAFKKQKT